MLGSGPIASLYVSGGGGPNIWLGITTTWDTDPNWSLGHVPVAGEDVIINDIAISNCVLDTNTADLGSFTATGKTFDPSGYTITISSDCTWSSGFDFISDADAMNGCSWIIGGDFTTDGQTMNATATWILTVTGSASAVNVGNVEYSDASGGTEIDATFGVNVDGGNNLNWLFFAQMEIVDFTMYIDQQLDFTIYVDQQLSNTMYVEQLREIDMER